MSKPRMRKGRVWYGDRLLQELRARSEGQVLQELRHTARGLRPAGGRRGGDECHPFRRPLEEGTGRAERLTSLAGLDRRAVKWFPPAGCNRSGAVPAGLAVAHSTVGPPV